MVRTCKMIPLSHSSVSEEQVPLGLGGNMRFLAVDNLKCKQLPVRPSMDLVPFRESQSSIDGGLAHT